ncbi:MAG: hypothetical protein FJZ67_00405 [Bacteroidetes bacterium]|nr:hypothetical protein [Bacteroidota bacterium]
MGYDCSAALSYKVDGIDMYQANRGFISGKYEFTAVKAIGKDLDKINNLLSAYQEVLNNLKSSKVQVNLDQKEPLFFKDVKYYLSFTTGGIFELTTGSAINGNEYSSNYELNEYIFEDEVYIHSPLIVLDLLIFSFFLSKKLPKSTIDFGLGDSALFWADFKLKNGQLKKFSYEYGDSEEGGDGFMCSKLEMTSFFKSLQTLNP